MKYFTSAIVVLALFTQGTTNAIQLKSDDLVKDITLEMTKDLEAGDAEATEDPSAKKDDAKKDEVKKTETKKDEKKADTKKADTKKDDKKTDTKKEDKKVVVAEKKAEKVEEDIPMDAAAIKAYSSVIADAAEDSAPAVAVVYTETIVEEPAESHAAIGIDSMGSMIQNEISSIKEASIKAAQESSE